MGLHQHQGSANALPAARAFVETGGTLMLSPSGNLEIGGATRWALPEIPAREARRGFIAGRRLARRLRVPSFARSVKCLVMAEGEPTPNGWLVLEGGAA